MNRKYNAVFGGVEYMSTSLLNEMAARGHECHLLSLDLEDATIQYPLHKNVEWHKIANQDAQTKAGWAERWKRFSRIRGILKENKIDIAIGFQDGAFLSIVVSALGLKTAVIAAERNSPSRFQFLSSGKYKNLTYNSFRLADAVTVQCKSYVEKYPAYIRNKIHVIPNPIYPIETTRQKTQKENIIISVGRISYQKNYDTLIHAFSKISSDYPDWYLKIVGDGEGRDDLEKLIKEVNITDKVILTGYQKNPAPHYESAKIFCLSSRWEGFPNALAEAMSYGLPAVGFAGCDGVSDLIQDQKTGVLAAGNGDDKTLEDALRYLLENEVMRKKMGTEAFSETQNYNPEKIWDMWEKLFNQIIKRKTS